MEKFNLVDCLQALRSDLEKVVEEGAGSSVKFLIDDVSMEFQVVAAKGAEASAGVKWWILSGDTKGTISQAVTQKLSLKLKVVASDGKSLIPMRDRG